MKNLIRFFAIILTLILPCVVFGQVKTDTLPRELTLTQCVEFALRNQPAVKQAGIDEQINERDIGVSLSAWLPQVTSSGNVQHYFKGNPPNSAAGAAAGTDIRNLSTLGLQANQVIFNNDVVLASKAAKFSREYYKQNTYSSQVNVVSDVSKAFFDVLLSEKQLNIINEDILRLQRSLKDAYHRYQAGVSDKTDYKQATISLNNSLGSRKQIEESIKSKRAYLKQLMGVAPPANFSLAYDSTRYEQQATIDTNQQLDINNRIEYRLLQTQKTLQNLNVNYYRWGFLPSLSAFGNYNLAYFSHDFSNLYNNSFPSAYAGLTLNIPIFTGGKRLQNLSKAKLQVDRIDLDIENTRNAINTEYVQALAGYKSNFTNWLLVKQNVDLAKDVYKIVSLQYREGVKTYLDVIVSQADLRTAELNYYNSLFQVLSSKIDLQRSLGILPVQ